MSGVSCPGSCSCGGGDAGISGTGTGAAIGSALGGGLGGAVFGLGAEMLIQSMFSTSSGPDPEEAAAQAERLRLLEQQRQKNHELKCKKMALEKSEFTSERSELMGQMRGAGSVAGELQLKEIGSGARLAQLGAAENNSCGVFNKPSPPKRPAVEAHECEWELAQVDYQRRQKEWDSLCGAASGGGLPFKDLSARTLPSALTGDERPALPLHRAPSAYAAPSFPSAYTPNDQGIEGRGGRGPAYDFVASETPMEKLVGDAGLSVIATVSSLQEKTRAYLKEKAADLAKDQAGEKSKDFITDNIAGSGGIISRAETVRETGGVYERFVRNLVQDDMDAMNAAVNQDEKALRIVEAKMAKRESEFNKEMLDQLPLPHPVDDLKGEAKEQLKEVLLAPAAKTTGHSPVWIEKLCHHGGLNGIGCRKAVFLREYLE